MTQITATVDYAAPGKQVGWLRVPHSVTRSAYGVVPVPIAVFNNGEGPRILLTAGNHGDEYEGQIVLNSAHPAAARRGHSGQADRDPIAQYAGRDRGNAGEPAR